MDAAKKSPLNVNVVTSGKIFSLFHTFLAGRYLFSIEIVYIHPEDMSIIRDSHGTASLFDLTTAPARLGTRQPLSRLSFLVGISSKPKPSSGMEIRKGGVFSK